MCLSLLGAGCASVADTAPESADPRIVQEIRVERVFYVEHDVDVFPVIDSVAQKAAFSCERESGLLLRPEGLNWAAGDSLGPITGKIALRESRTMSVQGARAAYARGYIVIDGGVPPDASDRTGVVWCVTVICTRQ